MSISIKQIFLTMILGLIVIISYDMPGLTVTCSTAALFAYLLKPIVDRLSPILRLHYFYVATVVYIVFVLMCVILIMLIIPRCVDQIKDLASRLPQLRDTVTDALIPKFLLWTKFYLGRTIFNGLSAIVSDFHLPVSHAAEAVDVVFHYASFTANVILMMLLFPLILFFLLTDLPNIEKDLSLILHKISNRKLRIIIEEIEKLVLDFLGACCKIGFIVSTYYLLALSIIGFEYSLLFSIIFGFAVTLPFLGPIIAIISCLAVSLLEQSFHMEQIWILVIFTIAQFVENIFLYPKIIGDKLGIHPLAVILSALIAGHFFGIIGVLISSPVVGIVRILIKKFLN